MKSCFWNRTPFVFGLLAATALIVLPVGDAFAFGGVDSCMNCHTGFRDGSPSLHSLHTDVVNTCGDCHSGSFSDPLSTNSSNNYAEYSCNGCHEVAGLATKHGAQTCGGSSCHDDVIGAAAGEDVLPYFYVEGRSGIVNPCRANAANGGEDLDGNGRGLDNDGDGLYDADDSDCDGIVPNHEQTWSVMKALFGED